jgi:hypothetical protein
MMLCCLRRYHGGEQNLGLGFGFACIFTVMIMKRLKVLRVGKQKLNKDGQKFASRRYELCAKY